MIPTYTFNALNSILFVLLLDRFLNTYLFGKKKFWYFMLAVMWLTFLFDNYLVMTGVYSFDSDVILNIFLPYAPVENFMMSFSLISANIIVFEWRKNKK